MTHKYGRNPNMTAAWAISSALEIWEGLGERPCAVLVRSGL